METDVRAPEGDPTPPETAPEAEQVQEQAPESAAPLQETSDELVQLRAEVGRLKAEVGNQTRAANAMRAQTEEMFARAARVESEQERTELSTKLDAARRALSDGDSGPAQELIASLHDRIQVSKTEEKVRTDTWGQAQQRIYEAERQEAYSNPAFGDLSPDEKYRLESEALGGGARTISAVTATWSAAIKERATMSVAEQMKALRADMEALKNAQTGAALNEAGGPESPAPAGGGGKGITTMADADEAYYQHKIDTPTYKEYRKQFGVT